MLHDHPAGGHHWVLSILQPHLGEEALRSPWRAPLAFDVLLRAHQQVPLTNFGPREFKKALALRSLKIKISSNNLNRTLEATLSYAKLR